MLTETLQQVDFPNEGDPRQPSRPAGTRSNVAATRGDHDPPNPAQLALKPNCSRLADCDASPPTIACVDHAPQPSPYGRSTPAVGRAFSSRSQAFAVSRYGSREQSRLNSPLKSQTDETRPFRPALRCECSTTRLDRLRFAPRSGKKRIEFRCGAPSFQRAVKYRPLATNAGAPPSVS